jgi:hypothetical protein
MRWGYIAASIVGGRCITEWRVALLGPSRVGGALVALEAGSWARGSPMCRVVGVGWEEGGERGERLGMLSDDPFDDGAGALLVASGSGSAVLTVLTAPVTGVMG